MGQSAAELRREIEVTRDDLGETLDAIGDRVSPGRMIERRKNRLANGLHQVRERVMGTASDTSAAIGDTAESAMDSIKGTPDAVRTQTQGNPLAAGAIAFGFGVLLASVFPASEKEKEMAGQVMDKAEPLKEELKHTGEEMAENLKEPAREAIEHVKETATEGQQAITETAKEAAGSTTQTAREAADTVRTEVAGDRSDQPR